MKLKQIALILSAATLSASALTANATYFGDENDLSWMPGRQVIKEQSSSVGSGVARADTAATPFVRFGDENNLSWLPGRKEQSGYFATSSAATPFVRFGDENDLSWQPRARRS